MVKIFWMKWKKCALRIQIINLFGTGLIIQLIKVDVLENERLEMLQINV